MTPLFWFRRDLRVFANEALVDAVEKGAKHALFFVCKKQWQIHGASPIQLDLQARRLEYLGKKLASFGIELHIREADTFADVPDALSAFCEELGITDVFANHEYEVNERERDAKCADLEINLHLYHGNLLCKPLSITTADGEMYKVFTPFKRAWLKQYEGMQFGTPAWPLDEQNIDWELPKCVSIDKSSEKWPVDDESLAHVVERFVDTKLADYDDKRDFPAIKATSGLSPYLALGIVSVTSLLAQVQQRHPDVLQSAKSNLFSWVNELLWREFYNHLIYAHPKLCKYKNFNEKYNKVAWRDSDKDLQAWCDGKTGYPLVDAAMRQLVKTGWMHNRLRMVVASFLTKHLLIDWRQGEAFFMKHLIDGDLAANNGGWQWAASTGCDAQPYFRIFNPITQSERFDPDGEFIRKYLPELENIPTKSIHFPHKYIKENKLDCYWEAIVDHKAARERALQRFKVDD